MLRHSQKRETVAVRLLADRALRTSDEKQLIVDVKKRILCNGVVVSDIFSQKEAIVLEKLLEQGNRLVSRETVATGVWNGDDYTDWALDRLISRLRKKLLKLGYQKDFLITIPGKGFQLRQV